MICTQCGQNLPEDSHICGNCGAPVASQIPQKEGINPPSDLLVSPGITMGSDGILRWVYEMNMWSNPTLLITIWKVLVIGALAPALLMFLLSLGDGLGFAMLTFVKIMGIVVGVVSVVLLLAYSLIALMNGGKYCVIFEMDDNSIKHIQMQKQFKKSQLLSMVVVLAGLMNGNVQTTAAGLLSGSKQSVLSSFEKVESITINAKRHVIYVNEKLSRNQIYAEPADFGFVTTTIIRRCKNAKVTYK